MGNEIEKVVIGDAELYLADCMDILPTLTGVDCVIADPPYFLPAQHYQTRKTFSRNFGDLGILDYFFKNFFGKISNTLKPTGRFYVFCDGQSYPIFYYHAYPLAKSVRPLIWDKLASMNGYHWRHQHEIILFGEMSESAPVPTGDGDIIKERAVKVDERQHGAEKPVELLIKLVSKSSVEGDIVCDPFMGSGSTGVACARLGRRFIGIEIEKKYFDIACERIDREHAQGKLF